MEIKANRKKLVFGETLHSGIGQGYFLTTPLTTMFNDSTIGKWWF